MLSRYRYLRSTYLHAFVGGASETRFKERLGDLFHEGYLDRPAQQWMFADARFSPVVHELGPGARRAIQECGGAMEQSLTFLSATGHRQFHHSVMICEVLASIELGTWTRSELRFISWPEILARAPEAVRASSMPFRLPLPSGGHVVPDGVFGIEYGQGNTKAYRFFALEADRETMPVMRSKPGQTSHIAKLAAYDEIVGQQTHKTYWGIPNLIVLTVTTNAARFSDMLGKLSGGANAAFLFKTATERELVRPMRELLTEPWQRAGQAALSIADAGR